MGAGSSESIAQYLNSRRQVVEADPETHAHREAFSASFWLGCWILPVFAFGWPRTDAVSWALGAAAVILGAGLWLSASSLCQGIGLPRWQVAALVLLAFIPGVNFLIYVWLSTASERRWGPLWAQQMTSNDNRQYRRRVI